jgi:hypothetical protein
VIAAVALVTGCSSASDSTSKTTRNPRSTSHLSQRARSEAVSTARVACGGVSRRKFARDFGMRSTEPSALARRYARGYDASIRADVETACLAAILKRGR